MQELHGAGHGTGHLQTTVSNNENMPQQVSAPSRCEKGRTPRLEDGGLQGLQRCHLVRQRQRQNDEVV